MKNNNRKTGQYGEDLATEFLKDKGYLVEERNFSTRFGELDIVCWDRDILVFVEVKTKIGHEFGEPEDMVNKGKLSQVKRMAEVYVTQKTQEIKESKNQNWKGRCRVDVVGIVLTKEKELEVIRHHEAVY